MPTNSRRTEQFHYHRGLKTYLTSFDNAPPQSFLKSLLPFAIAGALLVLACAPYFSRLL